MRSSYNYINPADLAQLLAAIPRLNIRKWRIEQVQMLFKISYWCGLRINEALGLEVEDIDLGAKIIYLGKTKTEKQGTATIPNLFQDELTAYIIDKKGPLFAGMNYHIVYHWLRKLGIMLNLKALTMLQSESGEKTKTHIFRKSIGKDYVYGTHGEKLPLSFVQQKLRHNDIEVTSKYLKVSNNELTERGW